MARENAAGPGTRRRVAFVFSRKMDYPPVIHDIKAFYLSQEMMKQGAEVNWVQLGGDERKWKEGGINFSVLRAPRKGLFPAAFQVLRFIVFCKASGIQLVYEDEWLFLRKKAAARLLGNVILRMSGVKVVMDQRDPFVDFEVAAGQLVEGSGKYRRLSLLRSLLLRQADLIVLPSKAYAAEYMAEGIPKEKVLGVFRGVDPDLFTLPPGRSARRSALGLEDDFVVGWFGLMHPYRMVREIIVPLIENLPRRIPNAHFLIGGEGPLLGDFEKLRRGPAGRQFTFLGAVPYAELPSYIAACDVTICPVSTKFRFTMNSNWLKIGESIAVGTPIVASRTNSSGTDFAGVGGITWAETDYESFLRALVEVHKDLESRRADARAQASRFESFAIRRTIPMIVDRALALT